MTTPGEAVGNVVSREVGGLPVYAWAGIVGVGLYLGRRLSGGGLFGGGRAATPELVPFTDPNTTGYTATGEPASSGGAPAPTRPATNQQWRIAAVDYLVASGVDPVAAEQAIGRYLAGYTLNAADRAIIATAVRQIGNPPEAPPVPDTATPVPGTPRAQRYTTVMAPYGLGENLNQVAARIRRPTATGGLGTTTTPAGQPLTAAYLANVNGLNVSTSRALRRGTRIAY